METTIKKCSLCEHCGTRDIDMTSHGGFYENTVEVPWCNIHDERVDDYDVCEMYTSTLVRG